MVKSMDNILDYVKTKVDLELMDDEKVFDERLLLEITTAVAELQQLVKLNDTYKISKETVFSDLIKSNNSGLIDLCKSFIGLSVRLSFDPPTGSVLTSMEKSKDTIASRITIQSTEVLYD